MYDSRNSTKQKRITMTRSLLIKGISFLCISAFAVRNLVFFDTLPDQTTYLAFAPITIIHGGSYRTTENLSSDHGRGGEGIKNLRGGRDDGGRRATATAPVEVYKQGQVDEDYQQALPTSPAYHGHANDQPQAVEGEQEAMAASLSQQRAGEQTSGSTSSTMHILYGGHGSHPGFLKELQASVKSVLLNAPLDRALEIHFMLDAVAQEAISNILENVVHLTEWRTRNPLTIRTYNVDPYVDQWIQEINETYKHFPPEMNRFRHTPGSYFRLFADEIMLPNRTRVGGDDDEVEKTTSIDEDTIQNVLWMDSDVYIMSNLERLWQQINTPERTESYIFQWGQEKCAGFIVVNVPRLKDFWQRIKTYPLLTLTKNYTVHKAQKTVQQKGLGDQFLVRSMAHTEPGLIGFLPDDAWDVSANNGPWWDRNERGLSKPRGVGVHEDRPKGVGMLHFNGGGSDQGSVFDGHPFLTDAVLFAEEVDGEKKKKKKRRNKGVNNSTSTNVTMEDEEYNSMGSANSTNAAIGRSSGNLTSSSEEEYDDTGRSGSNTTQEEDGAYNDDGTPDNGSTNTAVYNDTNITTVDEFGNTTTNVTNAKRARLRTNVSTTTDFDSTWKLAHYYDRLDWAWARYMAESLVGADGGHPVRVIHTR